MSTRKKLLVLGIAAIALVALLLLAGSLPNLELQGGEPFPLEFGSMERGVGAASAGGSLLLLNIMRIIIIALLPIAILYLLFTPEGRQRLLSQVIVLGILLLLFSYLASQQTEQIQPPESAFQILSPLEAPQSSAEAPEFIPGDTRNLVTALSVGIAVILTLVLIAVAWVIWRRRHPPETGALVQLVQEAQEALDDIQAGGDLKNAVIRCYVEMGRALSEQRGIERDLTMTTREFEERLVREGLPEPSVRQLTRLFEGVRYGAQEPGLTEEQRAVECLTAIIDATTKTT